MSSFHHLFCQIERYESELLKNKLDGTPVVPIFLASKEGDKFKPFNRRFEFLAVAHTRSKSGQSMIDGLR
jgi:hypothetical protein